MNCFLPLVTSQLMFASSRKLARFALEMPGQFIWTSYCSQGW